MKLRITGKKIVFYKQLFELFAITFLCILIIGLYFAYQRLKTVSQLVLPEKALEQLQVKPRVSVNPTIVKDKQGIRYIIVTPTSKPDTAPWGIAKQLDEHTWTIKVGQDAKMATEREIFDALNYYRASKGVGTLSWNDKLADYARSRADYFVAIGQTDKHEGFVHFVEQEDGYVKLGFDRLGENASFGYTLEAVHVIEWLYAADPGHDSNQLNPSWSNVGIGVSGTATDLIFGGN